MTTYYYKVNLEPNWYVVSVEGDYDLSKAGKKAGTIKTSKLIRFAAEDFFRKCWLPDTTWPITFKIYEVVFGSMVGKGDVDLGVIASRLT